MTIKTAIEVLVLIALACNLVLTYGLVRKLKSIVAKPNWGIPRDVIKPAASWVIDPSRDNVPWDDALREALDGESIVILSVPGCPGCETVKREVSLTPSNRMPRTWVLVEPAIRGIDTEDYLATWPDHLNRGISPDIFELMSSFDNPIGYPVVMALRDGVVLASGNRLRDVLSAFGERPVARSRA